MGGETGSPSFEEQLASIKDLSEQIYFKMDDYELEWGDPDPDEGLIDLRQEIETILRGWIASGETSVRVAALNSEWCTKEIAEKGLSDSELVVRIRAAHSAGMTEELYLKALNDEMVDVREVAAKRTESVSALKTAFEDDSVRVKRAVVKHYLADESIALRCLDENDLPLIRTMLLSCPGVTEAVALKALAHRDWQVRQGATSCKGATEAVLLLALHDKHKSVRSQAQRRIG